jgi:hypothetical protein
MYGVNFFYKNDRGGQLKENVIQWRWSVDGPTFLFLKDIPEFVFF